MAIKALFDRFMRTVRESAPANAANVTVTFALATIPMVGFVGAAVDYSHANSVKTAMQAAADSTALMLSKTAATHRPARSSRPRPTTISRRCSPGRRRPASP